MPLLFGCDQTFSCAAFGNIDYCANVVIDFIYPIACSRRHGNLYLDSGKFATSQTILHDAVFKFWEPYDNHIQT